MSSFEPVGNLFPHGSSWVGRGLLGACRETADPFSFNIFRFPEHFPSTWYDQAVTDPTVRQKAPLLPCKLRCLDTLLPFSLGVYHLYLLSGLCVKALGSHFAQRTHSCPVVSLHFFVSQHIFHSEGGLVAVMRTPHSWYCMYQTYLSGTRFLWKKIVSTTWRYACEASIHAAIFFYNLHAMTRCLGRASAQKG